MKLRTEYIVPKAFSRRIAQKHKNLPTPIIIKESVFKSIDAEHG